VNIPLDPPQWASYAAIVSAICDLIKLGGSLIEHLEARRSAPDFMDAGEAFQAALSTYSAEETESILSGIDGCRERFIREWSGPLRRECTCSVLGDVLAGNGGTMPPEVPVCEKTYKALECGATFKVGGLSAP
jgi:hypothetical protein